MYQRHSNNADYPRNLRDAEHEQSGTRKSAPAEFGRILDAPPVLAHTVLRGETLLTKRWTHGELHGYLPPFASHIMIAHYGVDQEIVYRNGRSRMASRTRPGSITLIPLGHEGRWDLAGRTDVSHVYLGNERLQECADLLCRGTGLELLDRVGFEDFSAARIMEILARDAETSDPSGHLFVEQAVDLLCTQLVRAHSTWSCLADASPRRGLADWQVKKVTTYMRDHLHEDVGLDELARVVNLSRFHFCTTFRLATGRTPYEWLVRERIHRACELLRNPALTVTVIGLEAGYGTPSAFAASFRKVMGFTASEYRRCL
jgi:AraC family transcriptional regulator